MFHEERSVRCYHRCMPETMCPYGDPSCPCPDGLLCHYEGEGAWPSPAYGTITIGAAADTETVMRPVLAPPVADSLKRFEAMGWA